MVKATLLKIYNRVIAFFDWIFDKCVLRGADFSGFENDNLPKNYINYEPARLWAVPKRIFAEIEKKDILDIGCGKGRMLWYFHKLGFKEVAGIEYSKHLAETARKNMQHLKIDADIYNADARTFNQYNLFSVFYIYNSFLDDVMEDVMKQIEQSVIAKPRKVTIIYLNPRCSDIIVKSGMFTIQKSFNSFYRRLTGLVVNVYENNRVVI